MNLHLLPADNKLFIPKFVKAVVDSKYAQNNILMCYVRELTISDIAISFATPELVVKCIKNNHVRRVIFHALQPQAHLLLKIIKKEVLDCRIDWVYWGESIDNPSILMLKRTLKAYLNARGVPELLSTLLVKTKIASILLNDRARKTRANLSKYIKYIDTMFHWSIIDYELVKVRLDHNQLKYQKFFYDIADPKIINSDLIEQTYKVDPSKCVVIGHSSSVRNNHLDILANIGKNLAWQNRVLILPISYGSANKPYVERIIKYIKRIPNLSYRIIDKFYPAPDYLSFLSKCSAYIAPGCGSIGAGNMVSYALSGRIPITAQCNSTGVFLQSLGADVAIYKNMDDIIILLDNVFGAYSQKNRMIVGDYFSDTNKQKCYENLLAIN